MDVVDAFLSHIPVLVMGLKNGVHHMSLFKVLCCLAAMQLLCIGSGANLYWILEGHHITSNTLTCKCGLIAGNQLKITMLGVLKLREVLLH